MLPPKYDYIKRVLETALPLYLMLYALAMFINIEILQLFILTNILLIALLLITHLYSHIYSDRFKRLLIGVIVVGNIFLLGAAYDAYTLARQW